MSPAVGTPTGKAGALHRRRFLSPVTAAVANAVYDAVAIRLREVFFTPDRVLAALTERG